MRIMLDSNVLFSALAFPGSIVEEIVGHIKRNHTIVLSEYIIIPILVAAIEAQVDLLITGDTDFEIVKIDKPKILKPREYADEYMRGYLNL